MPKLGLKCFIGSFLLSLVAVFAVTKAYFVLSLNEQRQTDGYADNVPTRNIELFAVNEENDPLLDKFNNLNKHEELPVAENDEVIISDGDASSDDSVLYQPQEDTSASSSNMTDMAEASEPQVQEPIETADLVAPSDNDENNELQIADSSTAPVFKIPLIHHYKTEGGSVTYSDSADDNQIASASRDVPMENLGVDSTFALTEPLASDEELITKSEFASGLDSSKAVQEDSPWKVAEVANKHVGKNSFNEYTAEHHDSIAAPDQEASEAPREEYRMQENILIPIPESIRNERNLTPQLSTSEENLKLERELRAKHKLPALLEDTDTVPVDDDDDEEEQDFDEDEETSKSLTDSIAEWFSGSKKKKSEDSITAPDVKKIKKEKSSQNSEGSIFNKLLGIGKGSDENIVPSELKLSFQPNRAEISGQTLEWLHAFSDNSVKNEDVFIEIRIDRGAPYALQEKRLKLLYKILADNGVDYHKINIIFTDREPNSFIIRNIRYASEEDMVKAIKRADNPWY